MWKTPGPGGLGTTVVGAAQKEAHAVGVDPTPEEAKRPLGRRIVLGVVGFGALAVVFGEPIQRAVDAVLSPVRRVDATGLTDLIPGEGGWRYYSVTARQPSITTAEYQLQVDGLVERPRTFTWDDLEQQPQTHWTNDFQCVTGWRVQDVAWQGVQLRHLFNVVGLKSEAKAFRFYSHDGTYTESLTREQALKEEVMVATHLDGDVVSADHGGPARLLVVPMYGYKSLKWLARIEAVDQVDPGYWEERGYDVDAYVGASNGRSDDPIT